MFALRSEDQFEPIFRSILTLRLPCFWLEVFFTHEHNRLENA
jgi:hypothetical protein